MHRRHSPLTQSSPSFIKRKRFLNSIKADTHQGRHGSKVDQNTMSLVLYRCHVSTRKLELRHHPPISYLGQSGFGGSARCGEPHRGGRGSGVMLGDRIQRSVGCCTCLNRTDNAGLSAGFFGRRRSVMFGFIASDCTTRAVLASPHPQR